MIVVEELAKGVKVVRPATRAAYPYSNSLYIDDEIKTLIDAGAGCQAYQPVNPEGVDLLLLTHYHFDHTHGTSLFPGAKIMTGREEAAAYSDPEFFYGISGLARWERWMEKPRSHGFSSVQLPEDVLAVPGYRFIHLSGAFEDGQVLDLGRVRLTALHTPGHTCGHYSFWLEKEGILFSADLDLAGQGPWYGDGSSDFSALVDSVQRLLEMDPVILVTSHRRVFHRDRDDIKASLKNYLQIALKREDAIHALLDVPRSREEIAASEKVFTRKAISEYEVFWNQVMTYQHLLRLEASGRITAIDGVNKFVRTGG
mgnify:CR=1 FL=1|jgi:ribonuclease/clavin/mitogillin